MVARRSHGTNTIRSSWQAPVDGGTQPALPISSVIDALEENDLARILSLLSCEVVTKRLDGNVSVSNDLAIIKLLRGGIVSVVRVSERSSGEVVDLQVNIKVGVCLDIIARLRVLDNC